MNRILPAILSIILSCLIVNQVFGCTTFCLKSKGAVLFGRNYDWNIGDALIFVNKRGIKKTATVGESALAAAWVSKFGSVTFNQYGRENPTGGMNEVGVVVEQMWLDETEYSKDESLPSVGTQEWIQYELDTSANVAEAITNAQKVRIVSDVKVHYLVSDKSGQAATIEFLNGKMVVHNGNKLSVPTLTNDTYDKSVAYMKSTVVAKATSSSSLDRFVRAADKTANFDNQPKNKDAVNNAFDILDNVAQRGYTQWSIVYDQIAGKIYFRTLQNPQIKSIDTRSLDYSCGTQVKILDINFDEKGDVTAKLSDYTRKANRDLIERSFNGTSFLRSIPNPMRNYLAAYPEGFSCGSVGN